MKYLKKIIAVALAAGMIISNAPVQVQLQTRTAGHLREIIIGMISVLTILMRIILMRFRSWDRGY